MSSPKGKEKKTRGREIFIGSTKPWQGISAENCAVLFVLFFCFVVLGGSVPDMTNFYFRVMPAQITNYSTS